MTVAEGREVGRFRKKQSAGPSKHWERSRFLGPGVGGMGLRPRLEGFTLQMSREHMSHLNTWKGRDHSQNIHTFLRKLAQNLLVISSKQDFHL